MHNTISFLSVHRPLLAGRHVATEKHTLIALGRNCRARQKMVCFSVIKMFLKSSWVMVRPTISWPPRRFLWRAENPWVFWAFSSIVLVWNIWYIGHFHLKFMGFLNYLFLETTTEFVRERIFRFIKFFRVLVARRTYTFTFSCFLGVYSDLYEI